MLYLIAIFVPSIALFSINKGMQGAICGFIHFLLLVSYSIHVSFIVIFCGWFLLVFYTYAQINQYETKQLIKNIVKKNIKKFLIKTLDNNEKNNEF
jgi:hypothetical protein